MKVRPVSIDYPLILASASPRRKRLLAQMNLPFRVAASHVNEESKGASPEALCVHLAALKARDVFSRHKPAWVLGADTIVVADSWVLGKPRDQPDAFRMLSMLSGRSHGVMTGICLLNPEGDVAHNDRVLTDVRFKPLTEREIKGYIQTGEPSGKAGGYAIQGVGAFMVESVRGSYTNVVGLPVCHLIKIMLQCGALKEFP